MACPLCVCPLWWWRDLAVLLGYILQLEFSQLLSASGLTSLFSHPPIFCSSTIRRWASAKWFSGAPGWSLDCLAGVLSWTARPEGGSEVEKGPSQGTGDGFRAQFLLAHAPGRRPRLRAGLTG